MEEWKEYKLGDILTIKYGKDHKQLADGKIPIYGSGGIMRYGDRSLSEGPSILIPRKGSLNNIMFTDKPFWTVDTMFWTIIDQKIANPLFVYYSIFKKDFASLNVGSAVPSLTVPIIEDIDISLPSRKTQDKIVFVLKSLDDKIEVNRQINDNLQQQIQAFYKTLFVDFEPFKEGEFEESELGIIPKGWNVGKLGELIDIKYGKDHKKLLNGSFPVYGSGGLMRYAEKALYKGESVLIPRKGTLNNVMYVNEAFWTVDTMFYSVPKVNNIMSFVYIYLKNKDLSSFNAGSAVPSMTTEILNNMKVMVPTDGILEEFNKKAFVMFSAIKQNQQESRRLSCIRDSLLPKLISGELTINDLTM